MLTRTKMLVAVLGLAITAPAMPGASGIALAGSFERQIRQTIGKIPRSKIREAQRGARRDLKRIHKPTAREQLRRINRRLAPRVREFQRRRK